MGQTTAYNKDLIKSDVLKGENKSANEAKYIHGKLVRGCGHFTEDMIQKIINIVLEIHQLNLNYIRTQQDIDYTK